MNLRTLMQAYTRSRQFAVFCTNTRKAYTRDLDAFLRWISRHHPTIEIAGITCQLVQEYCIKRLESGVAIRTMRRHVSSLRALFTFALSLGHLQSNPLLGFTWDGVEEHAKSDGISTLVLEEAELARLCQAPQGDHPRIVRDRAMLALLSTGFLRVAELVNLHLEDLDLQQGKVFKSRGSGLPPMEICLNPGTIADLREYVLYARPCLEKRNRRGGSRLFLSQRGRHFSRQGVWKTVRRYGKAAEIKQPVGPEVMRQTGKNLRNKHMSTTSVSTTERVAEAA